MSTSSFDPKINHFQTSMKGVSRKQLEIDCSSPRRISMHKHFYCKEKNTYSVPGLLLLKFLRPAVIKMSKEYKDFPLKFLLNFTLSVKSTWESPLYLNEDFIFKIQVLSTFDKNGTPKRFVTKIEIERIKDHEVVLFAQSDYVNFHLKRGKIS